MAMQVEDRVMMAKMGFRLHNFFSRRNMTGCKMDRVPDDVRDVANKSTVCICI